MSTYLDDYANGMANEQRNLNFNIKQNKMSNYDNTNKGIAFKQTSKTNEKAPDLKGKINVNGKEYELAGWIRLGKNGEFYSLQVQEPRSNPAEKTNNSNNQQFKDQLPF